MSWTEIRLIRTIERVEQMKDTGRWSFRQPKKQRGVGGLTKTHWDYLLDEMVGDLLLHSLRSIGLTLR